MILDVPVYMSNGKEIAPVEIQIRTIAMDFWASLEHQRGINDWWFENCRIFDRRTERLLRDDCGYRQKMQDMFKKINLL